MKELARKALEFRRGRIDAASTGVCGDQLVSRGAITQPAWIVSGSAREPPRGMIAMLADDLIDVRQPYAEGADAAVVLPILLQAQPCPWSRRVGNGPAV